MKNGVPEYELTINQGADFYKTVTFEKGNKPMIITGAEFKFAGRYNLTDKKLAFVGEVEPLDDHTIRLYISDKVTGKLQAGTDPKIPKIIYYDVQMRKGDDDTRILQGQAKVYAGHAFRVTGLDDVPDDADRVRDLIAKEVSKIADIDLSAVTNLSNDVNGVKKSIDSMAKDMLTADQVSKLINQKDHLSTEQVQSIVNDAINALDGEGDTF